MSEAKSNTAWVVLERPLFRAIWISGVISGVGSVVQEVSAGWLMTTMTTSPLPVALLQTAMSLPVLFLAIPAGALSDIVNRRWLMIGLLGSLSMLALSLAKMAYSGSMTPESLLGIVFAMGALNAFYAPASMRTVPDVLEGPEIALGVTLNSTAVNIARFVGATLAGLVLAYAARGSGFLINALTFVAPLLVLTMWSGPKPVSTLPNEGLLSAMGSGLRYARHSKSIRAVLVRCLMFAVFGSAIPALMPVVAKKELHLDAMWFGVLTSMFGLGALLGATVLAPLRKKMDLDALLVAMSLILAGTAVGLGYVRSLPLLGVILVIGGAAWVSMVASFGVATGSSAPAWVLARMLSLYMLVFQGSNALGSAAWGQLSALKGVDWALSMAGAGLVISALTRWLWPIPKVSPASQAPSQHWPTPPLVVAEEGQLPVLITVAYQVDDSDVARFVALMVQVRLERLRDGAYHWGLFTDPERPGEYLEHFLLPNWLEHLRMHERVTVGDRDVETEVRRFHRGEGGPVVRHYVAKR